MQGQRMEYLRSGAEDFQHSQSGKYMACFMYQRKSPYGFCPGSGKSSREGVELATVKTLQLRTEVSVVEVVLYQHCMPYHLEDVPS